MGTLAPSREWNVPDDDQDRLITHNYVLIVASATPSLGRGEGRQPCRTLSADARKADCEHAELCTNYLKILLILIFTRHRGDKEEATPDSGASHV